MKSECRILSMFDKSLSYTLHFKVWNIIQVLFFLSHRQEAATVVQGLNGRGLPVGHAPRACWLTRTNGSSLRALPPSPFVFQCSALISYQSHTSHSTYTVKALKNIRENNRAPKYSKRSKVLSYTHWGKKVTARFNKKITYTQAKVSLTLMFPLSILSPFLGSFFMPPVSVKFSDHCHFLHFSAELLALGENIARNICRLIVDCTRHWHRFSDMIFIVLLQLIARFAHANS